MIITKCVANNNDDENLIIVTWSNHLAANPDDGSAGKQAVSNTAKDDAALYCIAQQVSNYIALNFITIPLHLEMLQCIANLYNAIAEK